MSVGCSVRPCPVLEVPDNYSGTGVSCSRDPSTVFTWSFQIPFCSQPSYLEDILSRICYRSLVSFSYPADESWSIGDSLGTNSSPVYLKGVWLSLAGSSVFYNFLLFLPCLEKKRPQMTTDLPYMSPHSLLLSVPRMLEMIVLRLGLLVYSQAYASPFNPKHKWYQVWAQSSCVSN